MEWTEFNKKLNRWHEFTENNWWLRSCGEPLLFQFLWKLKFQVRPPYFANPFLFAAGSGTFFGLAMLLIERNRNHFPIYILISLAFGAILATWFWVEGTLRKLPRWEDL